MSIRARLLLLIAVAFGVAQLGVGLMSAWSEVARFGAARRDALHASAEAIAAAAAPGIRARDAELVRGALKAIANLGGVQYAGLAADGMAPVEAGGAEALASGVALDEASPPPSPADLLRSRTMELTIPVRSGGAVVGRLTLVADVSAARDELLRALGACALAGLVGLALALAVALRMQRSITRPLADLTGWMRRIGETHDYSAALPTDGRGEVGLLVAGFNGLMADVRARDAALAAHRSRLEAEVEARTADLRVARDRAEAATRAKSDFLATMSHEIRTPMNGVLVTAEVLAAADLPPRAKRLSDIIFRSSRNLLAVINDILDVSKIEAGKLEVERLVVDPAVVADDVLQLFAERAQEKGLDLAAPAAFDAGCVVADPVRLGQVLSNLVNNALKFTERGGVSVEIGRDPADAGRVRFCVADTGVGIAREALDTIFAAFSQADQTTTRRFGGTGLGLTIARRLVEAMGGDLRVTSEVGAGSRFFFSLPAVGDAPRAAPAAGVAAICVEGAGSRAAATLFARARGLSPVLCAPELLDGDATLVVADAAALRGRRPRGDVLAVAAFAEEPPVLRCGGRLRVAHRPLSPRALAAALDGAEAGAAAPDVARYGARALVVDDSPVNLEVARAAMERFGLIVETADGGLAALERLAQARYDIVFMDGSMPDLDGFETTRRIRAQEAAAGAAPRVVVGLTAHVVGLAAEAWRDAGMDDVLHKPLTLDALGRCLARHLGEGAAIAQDTETGVSHKAPVEGALDAAVLADLRAMADGDMATVRRIVALYLDLAPKTLAKIDDAVARADIEACGGACHALKSMSLNLGARGVGDLAHELERDARAERRLPPPARIAELRARVGAAIEALQAA